MYICVATCTHANQYQHRRVNHVRCHRGDDVFSCIHVQMRTI